MECFDDVQCRENRGTVDFIDEVINRAGRVPCAKDGFVLAAVVYGDSYVDGFKVFNGCECVGSNWARGSDLDISCFSDLSVLYDRY